MFKDKLVLSFTKKIIGNQNLYITYTNVDSQWLVSVPIGIELPSNQLMAFFLNIYMKFKKIKSRVCFPNPVFQCFNAYRE